MTADVSRAFVDRNKHFRAVVHQQGRLPTDAEENQVAELAISAHDSEFDETISPLGTPDDGFRIVVPTGVNDAFQIRAGTSTWVESAWRAPRRWRTPTRPAATG